jgi:hypothetical protein
LRLWPAFVDNESTHPKLPQSSSWNIHDDIRRVSTGVGRASTVIEPCRLALEYVSILFQLF